MLLVLLKSTGAHTLLVLTLDELWRTTSTRLIYNTINFGSFSLLLEDLKILKVSKLIGVYEQVHSDVGHKPINRLF